MMASSTGGAKRKSGERGKHGDLKDVMSVTSEQSGLFVYNNETPPEGYNIDIIAVHGLGGHWLETWKHDNGRVWLRDFLPGQLREIDIRARIMSFGYNADTAFTKADSGIADQAMMLLDRLEGRRLRKDEKQRPILFLAHSLGGLLVKKLMILAWERDDIYGDLLEKIRGAVFFGVPHRGADLAFWADFPAKVLKHASVGFTSNTKFLDALKRDSYERSEISRSFVRRAASLNIRTFYETERTGNILASVTGHPVVVDQDSARLNVPNEIAVGVADSNHRTICKFDNEDSQRYEPVWRAVMKMAQDSLDDKSFTRTTENSPGHTVCLQLLYTTNYKSHRRRNIPHYAPGTCEWFLRHSQFIRWEREPCQPILWLSADPGWGKSVLSSFLVDRLKSSDYGSPNVCYFFFSNDYNSQNSPTHALCTILHQLFVSNPALILHAEKYYNTMGVRFVEDFDTLWDILISCSSDEKFGNVICVFDALDECDPAEMRQLHHSMISYQNTAGNYRDEGSSQPRSPLRFILTSRPRLSIEDEFYDVPLLRVKAENRPDLNRADVDMVIRREVHEFGQRRRLAIETLDHLINTLIKKADGTFLWVALVLRSLKTSSRASKAAIEELIRTVPPTLDSLYEHILQQASNPDDVKKILHIVIAASVPLSLEQINDAFCLEFTEQIYDNIDREPSFETTIRGICGLFIRIVDEKVHFIHQTARDFLIQLKSPPDNLVYPTHLWKASLDTVESHAIMARICLFYLQLSDFRESPLANRVNSYETPGKESEVVAYLAKYPLLEYAAGYWDFHLRECYEPPTLLQLSFDVCNPISKSFSLWFNLSKYASCYRYSDYEPSLLVLRSWMGHEKAVSVLLENHGNIDETDIHGFTALHGASMVGNDALVSMLIRRGADLHTKDNLGFTALHLAAFYGHKKIAQQLLEAGADAALRTRVWESLPECSADHDESSAGWTPLHLAIRHHNTAVVEILLDWGVDIELKCSTGLSPLHSAVLVASIATVELLLRRGAQIEPVDGHSLTPLNLAAQTGNEALVRILLENRASHLQRNNLGMDPLHSAIAFGNCYYFSAVFTSTLMEENNSIKERYKKVFLAKKYGHEYALLSHLHALDTLHLNDRFGWCVNHMTAQDTQAKIVQLLLDKGISVSSMMPDGSTALHLATSLRKCSIVRLLIHAGADVNAKKTNGETPLHTAMMALRQRQFLIGRCEDDKTDPIEDIISLLLDNGAPFNEQDTEGLQALHCAALAKEQGAVRYLLSQGADPNTTENRGRTALHHLVMRINPISSTCKEIGCPWEHQLHSGAKSDADDCDKYDIEELQNVQGILNCLLQYGADINSQDSGGYSPLHFAAGARDREMVKILLESRALVNIADKQGQRPLHLAIDKVGKTGSDMFWSKEGGSVVELLLDRGADIDAKDAYRRTPLNVAASMPNYVIANILLRLGAKVNAPDWFGQTPLHSVCRAVQPSIATDRSRADIVNLLLRHGADLALLDTNGQTPEDLADSSGLERVLFELKWYNICFKCNRRADTKRCTGCMLARYCAKKCQRDDWASHKEDCNRLQEVESIPEFNIS